MNDTKEGKLATEKDSAHQTLLFDLVIPEIC